ncbi:MAG: aminotransferase class I/II-fold pyridoxal phosphate-dependent enzyme [Theionarchaea archaeon]|nr:aminotransferase class I/II-fold pyridoxal phosphate-dependent enzyme [Theionarchaea archaeon]MBU7038992.1 aminotransferase class I/II-fold pyridoxal phosphate-dependent enzyme [Theionarchaea archaeon]
MNLADRVSRIEYAIRDVVVPATELEKKGITVMKLNIGDPLKFDFETPHHMIEALCQAAEDNMNFYGPSEGLPRLRQAICNREQSLNTRTCSPEQIIVTNGISEGISMLFGALLEPNDEILVPGPSYPPYMAYARFYGGKSVSYRTIEEEGWIPDTNDLEAKISERTKAIVVINPNNPTGAVYPKKVLLKLQEVAADHNVLLITDEIYDEMVFDKPHETVPLTDAPMVVVNGFSKVYLATGWRMGYAIFSNCDELKEAVLRQARIRLCTNTLCQVAAAEALEGSQDHIPVLVKKLKERRDFAWKRLNEIEGVSASKPEGAFYIFPKIPANDDKKFVLDLLREKHVLFVHGSGFCPEFGKGHLRSVVLPTVDVLEEAYGRLEEFVSAHGSDY